VDADRCEADREARKVDISPAKPVADVQNEAVIVRRVNRGPHNICYSFAGSEGSGGAELSVLMNRSLTTIGKYLKRSGSFHSGSGNEDFD
jgi:hypothetical protein